MGKRARPRVVAKDDLDPSAFPDQVSLAMDEIAASAKEGPLALSVAAGLKVMSSIFEQEVTTVVGPKSRHDPDRVANRHGTEPAHVVLGGQYWAAARLAWSGRACVRSTGARSRLIT